MSIDFKMEFLTKEEIEDFRKAFNLFDNDGSGTISSRELITAMQNLNLRPKEDEIQNIMKVKFFKKSDFLCTENWITLTSLIEALTSQHLFSIKASFFQTKKVSFSFLI